MSQSSMSKRDCYAQIHSGFRWKVPRTFNIAQVCCNRWARRTPQAVAVIAEREDGTFINHTLWRTARAG